MKIPKAPKQQTPEDLFTDENLRTGGFYELAIQVCPRGNEEPVKRYIDYFMSLTHVEGPFDWDMNPISADIENIEHCWVLHTGVYSIPFRTFYIREDSHESDFIWFDICFYSSAISELFGEQYQVWDEDPKVPEDLKAFFSTTVKALYEIHPFLLAMADFEISGQYYLDRMQKPLWEVWEHTYFWMGKAHYETIAEENKKLVRVVEDMP